MSVTTEQPTEFVPGVLEPARPRFQLRSPGLPWLFLLPCTLFLLLMSAYPTVYAVYLSLTNAQTSLTGATFIGLNNYVTLFHDPNWWQALQVTVEFVIFAVGLEVVLGFLLALWLHESPWGNGLMSLFILPLAMSPVVVGYMFQYMYDGQLGIVTYLFAQLHIKVDLLASPSTVVPAIVAVDVWEWTPFALLIFLAGLKTVPDEALEAAQIDGASYWSSVYHIILPLMRASLAVVLLFRLLDALKVFDIIYTMTAGGPARASETVSLFISESAFQNVNMGYAAAIAFVLLVISVIATRLLARIAVSEATS